MPIIDFVVRRFTRSRGLSNSSNSLPMTFLPPQVPVTEDPCVLALQSLGDAVVSKATDAGSLPNRLDKASSDETTTWPTTGRNHDDGDDDGLNFSSTSSLQAEASVLERQQSLNATERYRQIAIRCIMGEKARALLDLQSWRTESLTLPPSAELLYQLLLDESQSNVAAQPVASGPAQDDNLQLMILKFIQASVRGDELEEREWAKHCRNAASGRLTTSSRQRLATLGLTATTPDSQQEDDPAGCSSPVSLNEIREFESLIPALTAGLEHNVDTCSDDVLAIAYAIENTLPELLDDKQAMQSLAVLFDLADHGERADYWQHQYEQQSTSIPNVQIAQGAHSSITRRSSGDNSTAVSTGETANPSTTPIAQSTPPRTIVAKESA